MKASLSTISLGSALLLTIIATGCATAGGKATARVSEEKKYIRLDHLGDTSEQTALKQVDTIAMTCSKCRTVRASVVQASAPRTTYPYRWTGTSAADSQRFASAGGPFEGARHYCPGCKSTITTTGTGKNRTETIKHTCAECGDNSPSCCATKRDALPTEGMAKK